MPALTGRSPSEGSRNPIRPCIPSPRLGLKAHRPTRGGPAARQVPRSLARRGREAARQASVDLVTEPRQAGTYMPAAARSRCQTRTTCPQRTRPRVRHERHARTGQVPRIGRGVRHERHTRTGQVPRVRHERLQVAVSDTDDTPAQDRFPVSDTNDLSARDSSRMMRFRLPVFPRQRHAYGCC